MADRASVQGSDENCSFNGISSNATRLRCKGARIIWSSVPEPEGVSPSRLRAAATDPVRAAATAFVLVEVAGFVFYLIAARKIWFFRDDWDFLAGRGLNFD